MSIERSELETTMTWDSEQEIVRIFSARRQDQTRLRRAGILPVKDIQPHGLFYEIPLSRLKWRIAPLPDGRPKRIRVVSTAFLQSNRHRRGK